MENNMNVENSKKFADLRVVIIDGQLWFAGNDVAEKLGYSNASKAVINHVDEEDKRKEMIVHSINGYVVKTQTTLINKRGVCSLISKSETKSKEYKDSFKNWLVSEGLIEDSFCIVDN